MSVAARLRRQTRLRSLRASCVSGFESGSSMSFFSQARHAPQVIPCLAVERSPAQKQMRRLKTQIPPEIEEYRDEQWRREGTRQVETAFDAERFIEQIGFAACLTDCRRPGPSLYVAVCGRRDAVMPRHV